MTGADILLIIVVGVVALRYLRALGLTTVILATLRSIMPLELLAALALIGAAAFTAARLGWRPTWPRSLRRKRALAPVDMTNVIVWPGQPR